ncbi:MAG: membrane protein insertase YidC [Candidatus Melainabacteria bacterium]|nr:membrane protein insertase YidC [Candidatus Melainabacteria bacterium]
MIPILEAIAKACHSYGWAIVLLTVLVRILVYPLVASSTRSMQRMAQMQPQLKVIQERYKSDPEMFQKKAMEFYQKNKINPMGGCLPTLVQLPILFALFATFTGPPFGDKTIPVKIKVAAQGAQVQVKKSEVSAANSPYVSADGKLSKIVVFPGDLDIIAGGSIDFQIRAIEGQSPEALIPEWRFHGDANGATIDKTGHAVFPKAGEVTVEAVIPGIAKEESFGFINSLGKVASGLDLFKPSNWDALALILLFGITMYLSQKLMVQPPSPNADSQQQLIQQQTQRTMPIAVTAMFFFIPLPAGVYLYMVVSNIIQSLQTWLIMRKPAPMMVDVLAEAHGAASSKGSISSQANVPAAISNTPVVSTTVGSSAPGSLKKPPRKKRSKKKK